MTETPAQKPTALNLLRGEIDRFLATDRPEVLCIRGEWGVGKTFSWELFLKEAHKAKAVKLTTYSYVSLFGLDGLDRFKSSIFENAIAVENIGTEPNIESLGASLKLLGKAAASAWKPGLGTLADHAAFLAVHKFIICIDDLERKGEKLRIIDILGLASLLKDRRKCKVVLILNEKQLSDPDLESFDKYSEKVIDSSLVFAPTPQEAINIAFEGTAPHEKLLAANCIKLGISNIRILKKLERLVLLVAPLLEPYDERVLFQAVSTLALFGWAVYGKQDGLLNFAVEKQGQSLYGLDDDKLNEKESAAQATLELYGFGSTDDFDKVLLDGIRTGFFDSNAVTLEASKLNHKYTGLEVRKIMDMPWDAYRDSFDDNAEAILSQLTINLQDGIDEASLPYLDGSIRLLKQMGKPEEAAKAIARYMAHNADRPKADFELDNHVAEPEDPDVRLALHDKLASYKDNRNPADVLFQIAKQSGWNNEDITLLSRVSEDEFYTIFKRLRGLELRSVTRKALEFGRMGVQQNEAKYKTIGQNALLALRRIASESPINAMRVRRLHGVKDDETFV